MSMINDPKRNIVMFTNINNEEVEELEFGFFFDTDRALFDEEVIGEVKTPGTSVVDDCAQMTGAAQPFYYLRRENSPSVRKTIMEAIENFCDKYNVVIISEY